MATMKLIIGFDDRPKDFTEGVEFGRIMEKLEKGEELEISNYGFPIRLANQELIYKACKIYGYKPYFKESTVSGWVDFIAYKNETNKKH